MKAVMFLADWTIDSVEYNQMSLNFCQLHWTNILHRVVIWATWTLKVNPSSQCLSSLSISACKLQPGRPRPFVIQQTVHITKTAHYTVWCWKLPSYFTEIKTTIWLSPVVTTHCWFVSNDISSQSFIMASWSHAASPLKRQTPMQAGRPQQCSPSRLRPSVAPSLRLTQSIQPISNAD